MAAKESDLNANPPLQCLSDDEQAKSISWVKLLIKTKALVILLQLSTNTPPADLQPCLTRVRLWDVVHYLDSTLSHVI